MANEARNRRPLWNQGLSDLADQCTDAKACDAPELAVRLFELISASPEMLRDHLGTATDRRAFLAHVGNDATECALLDLCGDKTSFVLSKSAAGSSLATIHMDGSGDEVTFFANSIALAMIGALAAALSQTKLVPKRPSRSVGRRFLH
ncbi:hypothetical protein D6858_04100 [Tsuneonella suprasediminis]|uniref:Uncharacterized protein n=1 Tax=Tsuneonella suprasediminis TaxID=2306996 RepID=A0A419R3I0_9SPHN|nr:hypothetical protein D6858_04100 [Tsuneonella suprasediminis]